MTPRLAYSLAKASEVLDLGVRSIRYLMKTGRLGYARVGRRVLIPAAELEKLLKRATVRAIEPLDVDEPIRPPSGIRNGNAPSSRLEAPDGNGVRQHAANDTGESNVSTRTPA